MKLPSCPALGAAGLLLLLTVPPLRAELKWESREVRYEARLGEDDVHLSFAFSNPTDQPVTITEVETSCGCTAATLAKKTYAPGEHGKLEVTFDAKGTLGIQQKTIQVRTSDAKETTTLTLRVIVPTWLEMSPRLVWWTIGEKENAKDVAITINEKAKLQITSALSDNATFTTSLQPQADGRGYRLTVKPLSTREALQATVTLVAEIPGAAARRYVVFAQVR